MGRGNIILAYLSFIYHPGKALHSWQHIILLDNGMHILDDGIPHKVAAKAGCQILLYREAKRGMGKTKVDNIKEKRK